MVSTFGPNPSPSPTSPASFFSGLIACEVLEVIPEEKLSITWRDADPANALDTTVTWTLVPEGVGTRLFLVHAGFDLDDPAQAVAHKIMGGGWRTHVLRQLERELDEGAATKI